MKDMQPGIYTDIPVGEYITDNLCVVPTLSSGTAKLILDRSPAHVHQAHPRFTPQEQEFSRQANFGSAVHAVVFGGQYICAIPYDGYTTKDARKHRDEALRDGLIPLVIEECARVSRIAATVTTAMLELTSDPLDYENTVIFKVGHTLCRSRPDAMSHDRRLLLDLKVTGTNVRDCNRQFFSQGHDMQAAFMERAADSIDPEGIGKREIFYLYVENEAPFAYSFLQVSEPTISIARKRMNAAINLWQRCLDTNEWPAYQSSRTLSSRPSYEETAWLVREETDPTINVEFPT